MKCSNCGSTLRPGDRFCSSCGAIIDWGDDGEELLSEETYPGEETLFPENEPEKRRSRDTETLFDEHLFRDSFLDKAEEGQQAFLMTITVLLIIATMVVGGLFLFTYLRQRGSEGAGQEVQTEQNVIIWQTEPKAEQKEDQERPAEGSSGEEAKLQESSQAESEKNDAGENEAMKDTVMLDGAVMEQIMKDEGSADRFGIYVYDLITNKSVSAGESDEKMFASATVTVPILYTAAVLLDQGRINLNDSITYVNSIGGRGEAFPEKREGQVYALSYYLSTMLTYSDNNCINCLIDYLTLDTINETCRGAGFASVDLQRKIVAEVTDGSENYVSARDLAMMVKELYNGKYTNISREFMKQYFRIDETDASRTLLGLAQSLPEGTVLLNQNGMGDTRFAEVAVVSADTVSYVISVMCSGAYGYAYEDAVQHISNYIYQSLSKEDVQ